MIRASPAPMYYPEFSSEFRSFTDGLRETPVAVLGHLRPDGDCIGSQVALCRVWRKLGIDAVCVNGDPVPRRLAFLVGDTPFFQPDQAPLAGRSAVQVDCADRTRPGKSLGKTFSDILGNIDHHISNTGYARHNFVDGSSAAAAEVLAGIFLDNGWPIDPLTAQGLYAGIATDTGQFRFPSTSKRVFSITGQLLDAGADPSAAAHELYEQESFGRMRLLQAFLASLRLENNGRVCAGILPASVFKETGTTSEDTEGLVDYARSIEGVEIALLIEEKDGAVKGSFRAKDAVFRVDVPAGQLNGGGHACAAGFNLRQPLDKAYPQILDIINRHLAEIDRGRQSPAS